MKDADPRYGELAATGPYAPEIGGALITMVQPNPGFEIAYNRWYEDDHFYAGALAMPWMFAGRRWVAPPEYRAVRFPADSPIAAPVTTGKYISAYWITAGRMADHQLWTTETNKRLRNDGRGFEERTHVYTAFQDYLGVTYRDATGPRDIHSLNHPYRGLVVEVIDSRPEVSDIGVTDQWLSHEYVPARHAAASSIAQTLRFRPRPLPRTFNDVLDVPGVDTRITLLHFLDEDPLPGWKSTFAADEGRIANGAPGTLSFCAPFIPTVVGTNDYVVEADS
jgi:hypothetical protein